MVLARTAQDRRGKREYLNNKRVVGVQATPEAIHLKGWVAGKVGEVCFNALETT